MATMKSFTAMRIQAGALRIEQRRVVLETTVLPLNYAPMCLTDKIENGLTMSEVSVFCNAVKCAGRDSNPHLLAELDP